MQQSPPDTVQKQVADTCPLGCANTRVLAAIPPPGIMANAWSRCQKCLAYWETSPSGELTVIKGVFEGFMCIECRQPLGEDHHCAQGG